MKITQEADYALRVVLYLSGLEFGERVEAKKIAEVLGLSQRFLLKFLTKLTAINVIKSYRGTNGGYALARVPEEKNMKEVIEAIDGPICVNRCLTDISLCTGGKNHKCKLHKAFVKVQRDLANDLESITFKDLIDDNF